MNRAKDVVGMRGLFVATLVTMLLIPTTSQATPRPQFRCGQVITVDTTLHQDLLGCPNEGLVIGADNIRLNLNGHTVGGNGQLISNCPDGASCDVGIDDTAGYTGVTIERGIVRGFDVAISASSANGSRVKHISFKSESSFGMLFGNATRFRLDHNVSLPGVISGIVVFGSDHGRIDHNAIMGAHGYGIPSFNSSRNSFDHNVLRGNDHGILLDTCNHNLIWANRVSHSGGSSLDIGHSNDNRIAANVVINNGDGIILFEAHDNQVRHNTVTGTGFFGFADTGGFGILFDGADNNLVTSNVVTGGRGPAVLVSSLDSQLPSSQNVISHNVANSKRDDGIRVDTTSRAIHVVRNTTNRNGDDGIDINAAGTIVSRNIANFNHDLGIEAVPGVIDGGGNRAKGSGNPLQCTNISCS
ncbi:MAG: hypothetical protein QOH48_253 [Actinomycetota bacterium]|nr:hypothetical protein [Actinomycetota bacterium]